MMREDLSIDNENKCFKVNIPELQLDTRPIKVSIQLFNVSFQSKKYALYFQFF